MTNQQKLRFLATILAVQFSMAAILVGVSFLMRLVYVRLGVQPAWLPERAIDALVGLLVCFVVLTAIGRFIASKQEAMRNSVFNPIIEAMGRIAKGDFSVRLDADFKDDRNGFMSELAKSVTNMAVELDQMEQMRQEFISNVSHEIQSPLTSIRGFAQAMKNDHLSVDERQHYLSVIETESTRLSRLTDNLLKLASLEAQSVRFEPKPYRLDRQIRCLILLAEPQWTEKALEMDAALAEVTMTADEDLLSQVWINLIHNSIKFTPEGGHVCVSLQPCAGGVEFRISDTGPGIPLEDQAHIFERFYKVDKARDRSKGGNGLGLAIAKYIVEMHSGSIAVESHTGTGSTFVVILPLMLP